MNFSKKNSSSLTQVKIRCNKIFVHSVLEASDVKKQNSMSKSEDLIGFMKGFINWAASHLATRSMLPGVCTQWKGFIGRKLEQGNN